MIWILADDRAGNVNQLLGIAESLNMPFERKDIRYNKWVKLPNFLRGSTFIGITKETQQNLKAPWPKVVLSAGRRSFSAAAAIHRLSGGKTKIVQLMNPGKWEEKKCDLLILPEHDQHAPASNIMQVLGTPHRVTEKKLSAEKKHWLPILKKYPAPRLGLIIGGATKDHPFTLSAAQNLVDEVKKLKAKSLLITTSRRTPKEVVELLQKQLPEPKFFYKFGDKAENPYFGLLSMSDKIVVTGDSMSMCSECCATKVPVFIFAPTEMIGAKHARFHQSLYKKGYATSLGVKEVKPKARLNPAPEIAKRIRKEFL